LVPAGVNNSQFNILKVFPNPTLSSSTVKFASENKSAKLFVVSNKGFICQKIDVSNLTEYSLDISKLSSGSYNLILVSDGYYSEAYTLIKQ
jgi:hypothetical protein